MTDILLIALLAAVAVLIILTVTRKGDSSNGEMLRILGDTITQNQKNTDEYQSKKFSEIDKNITEKQGEMNKAVVDSLRQMENRFKTFEESNENKLEAMRKVMMESLLSMQEDNSKKLENMRQTVDEKLQKTLEEKMNESFKVVSDRLEKVHEGLGEMQTLAVGVGDLKKVLSNVKTRGILGEIQLGAILREILSPDQYEENAATVPGSRNRVEFAIKMPNDGGYTYLPVDSKFPGDAFYNLQTAYEGGNPEEIKLALTTLTSRIKSFAKDIHEKYIEPPHTTDFAIMFLPFEGLYAEVVNQGLVEELQQKYKVNIAGPSTMAALLNSLQMGFRTLTVQKRSLEVWKLLTSVKTEFDKFADSLKKTQEHISTVSDDLDKLVGTRTRKMQVQLRAMENYEEFSDSTESE